MLSENEGFRFQQLKNNKYQITKTKWFDKLTTLSQVEGQITMTDPPGGPNNWLLILFEILILRFRIYLLRPNF